MADRRIDQLTEAEDISDEDLFVIWKKNISQTRSIKKGTMNLATKQDVVMSRKLDWSNAVTLTPSQLQTGYTVPNDGVFCLTGTSPDNGVRGYVTVNGIKIASSIAGATAGYRECQVQITVNEDDIVKTVDGNNNGQSWLLHASPVLIPYVS